MIEKALLIIVANLIFYFKTLRYQYCSDDIPANLRPKHPKRFWHWFGVLEGRARSLPQLDHLITMLIHTFVCLGIYFGFGANEVSFLAAFLFAFNPIGNQASVWISGRSYALPALGMTWILVFPVLAPLLLIGVTYYNAGFASPLVLLGSPVWYVAGFLPLAWAFNIIRFKRNVVDKVKMEMFHEDKQIKPEKLALFIKTFGFYTWFALFPLRTTFYHSFLQSAAGCGKERAYSIKCRFFWAGFGFLAAIAGWMATHPWSMVHFGLLWWVFCLLPFLNFVRIQQEIAERYAYLPLVGLMYVLAYILAPYPVLAWAWVAFYAGKMWFYMDAFRDDFYLTEICCMHDPGAWFAWHVKAMRRWDAKSHQEAFIYWTMARNISPREFKINLNLATALSLAGHREEGLKFLQIAEDNIPAGQEGQAGELIKKWREGKMAIVL